MEYSVVLVTAPSLEVGEEIGTQLVERELAACANILSDVVSIFSWQGAIQKDSEVMLVIKTRSELFERLAATVEALHPYETPEIIGLPILAGSRRYLEWIEAETSDDKI